MENKKKSREEYQSRVNEYLNSSTATNPVVAASNLGELRYRISVLDSFNDFCAMARRITTVKDARQHYKVLYAFCKFLPTDHNQGTPTDDKGDKERAESLTVLNDTITYGTKVFGNLVNDTITKDYPKAVISYLATVKTAWENYRNTLINLK